MESYRSDEEQVEVLRRWWHDNGRALLLGVLVALAVVLGWDGWKQHQARAAESAAVAYQNLVEVAGEPGSKLDEVHATTARHLGEQLKDSASRTVYASYAALVLGRIAQDRAEYNLATQELQWAVDHAFDEDLRRLANLRLAQALFGQGHADEAQARLDREKEAGYLTPAYQELRGDILLSRGDRAGALAAYQSATDWMQAAKLDANRVLELKRDALKQADAATMVPLAGSQPPVDAAAGTH